MTQMIVCLSLLATLSCAAGGERDEGITVTDSSAAGGVRLFDGAKIWRDYKRLFAKIDTARSLRALEKLSDDVDSLEIKLERSLDDSSLASDLVFVLNDLLRAQEAILDKPRGREPKTDYVRKLKEATAAARIYSRLVKSLLDAQVGDPWVVKNIFPEVPGSISAISMFSGNVRREIEEGYLQADGEIQGMLRSADEALAQAREVAAHLPAP